MATSVYRRIIVVTVMIIAGLITGGLVNAANAAGSVSVQQGKLIVSGGSEANSFFVTGNGANTGNFTVTDGTASISAGAGCTKNGSSVNCSGVFSSIQVFAGGGNDAVRLRNTFLSSDIKGGDGNDVLIGSSTARDFLFGEGGNDSLSGSGTDFLNGGTGFDKCSGASNKVACES
jgi:Ca2+-binding RTX toxin-like protein